MRAAVTQAVGTMEVVDLPEPPDPGPGQVVVGSMSVGICGSDYHFFSGHLTEEAGGGGFPKIQGHEVGGTIEALGPDCRDGLEVGQRVALWPLTACGHCYPCSVGRPNTCDNFQLIGIHVDGGLQELLTMSDDHVFPIDESDSGVAAMAEPVSIAVRAVQVGMSGDEVSLRVGSFTEKELDLLGVCCCGGGEFGDAVAAVERNGEILKRLISHEFSLEEAPEAIAFAMNNPSD